MSLCQTSPEWTVSTHLSLVPLSLEDKHAIFDLVKRYRTELGSYLYWVDSIHSLEDAENYLRERVFSPQRRAQWFSIQYQHQLVGVLGIKSIEAATAELGYWLSPGRQEMGLMSQALRHVLAKLKSQYAVEQVEIHCLEQNRASRALAEKFAGHIIRTIPDYMMMDYKIQDLLVYQIRL